MSLIDLLSSRFKRRVREAALDQKSLWEARMNAVYRLTDQSLLAQIALNDPDWNVRSAAVWLLTDQSLLAQIAKSDGDPNVRQAARVKLGLQVKD